METIKKSIRSMSNLLKMNMASNTKPVSFLLMKRADLGFAAAVRF